MFPHESCLIKTYVYVFEVKCYMNRSVMNSKILEKINVKFVLRSSL